MKKILIITGFVLLITLLTTCSMIFNTTKTVSPTIRAIGLPDSSLLGSITLTVSGSDMETIEVNYENIPSIITLSVPEGNNRTFELVVKLNETFTALPTTVVTSYRAKTTTNITSSNSIVTLTMGIGSTKLVVPDFQNARLLQFDNISDTTGISLDGTNIYLNTLLGGLNFRPYDIDFDNEGRIYIASNGFSTNDEFVVRVDNISGINPIFIGAGAGSSKKALTVDRSSNLLYYTTGSNLSRSNLDGTGESLLVITAGTESIGSIRGMAINTDGFLFLAGTNGGGAPRIFKYNPSTQQVIASYSANLDTPWDVLAKENYIYTANTAGADGWKVIRLDLELGNATGYGIKKNTALYLPDFTKGHFYGPKHFVAILNKKITIIDDNDDGIEGAMDKLISMDDILGTNWETLPLSSDGQSLFSFFAAC